MWIIANFYVHFTIFTTFISNAKTQYVRFPSWSKWEFSTEWSNLIVQWIYRVFLVFKSLIIYGMLSITLTPKNRIYFAHMKNVASFHRLSNTIIEFYGCLDISCRNIFRDGNKHHIHRRVSTSAVKFYILHCLMCLSKILTIQLYTDIKHLYGLFKLQQTMTITYLSSQFLGLLLSGCVRISKHILKPWWINHCIFFSTPVCNW